MYLFLIKEYSSYGIFNRTKKTFLERTNIISLFVLLIYIRQSYTFWKKQKNTTMSRRPIYGELNEQPEMQSRRGESVRVVERRATGWDIAELIFILLIFCLGVIIMVFVIIDWQSDRENTNNSNCYDGNPCTMDISYNDGSCENPSVQNGKPCNSSCVKTSNGTCNGGVCTGACPGSCKGNSDCPLIPTVVTFFPYSLEGECVNNICVYSTVALIFESTIGINSTYECSNGHEIDRKMCLGVIDNTMTSRDCLIVESTCSAYVYNATAFLQYIVLDCLYAFGCAQATTYPFLI